MLKVVPPVLLVLLVLAAPAAADVDPKCQRVLVTLPAVGAPGVYACPPPVR